MNTQDKSLKLAELMEKAVNREGFDSWWMPYKDNERGRAQAMDILLKFPEVVDEFFLHRGEWQTPREGAGYVNQPPNQTNILDEILRINGVDIDG